jgi:hypothetical protein
MPKHPEDTAQRKAAHEIMFVVFDKDDDGTVTAGRGLCTASAIGPHALLTAAHCDKGQKGIWVDNSIGQYNILGRITDGYDHIIFLVDGPAFKDTMGKFYPKDVQPTMGLQVFLYGDGGGMYPPMYRHGYYMGTETITKEGIPEGMPVGDLYLFDLSIIGGDSGSAIYDEHGNLVTLVTYGIEDHYAGAYPLHFTQAEVQQAEQYSK